MSAPRSFRRLCVFCGSSVGDVPAYLEAARDLGRRLATRGVGVVYGGAKVGLMGALADAALEAGGEVYGVIPEKLRGLEVAHEGLTELFVVDSMHARKATMATLSDGFIALPGGFGTLEEVFEVTTWTQLNYHEKPIGMLDVNGYYAGLQAFVEHAVRVGFVRPIHRELMLFDDDPDQLLARMASVEIPKLPKWIGRP